MDYHPYRQIIGITIFLLFAAFPLVAATENPVWIGELINAKVSENNSGEIIFSVKANEYIAEGTFDDFLEDKVVFVNQNEDLTQWTITLDNIAPGKMAEYRHDKISFIKSIKNTTLAGSFADPNFTQTKEGKPVVTSKFVVTGLSPIYIYFDKVDKINTSEVTLYFRITDKIPDLKLNTKNKTYMLEITIDDFNQKPVGNFLSKVDLDRLSPTTRKYLERLQNMRPDHFVTLIYRAKYHETSDLQRQLDKIKSELGEVETLDNNSQIMIRDRAGYVLEMLHLLLAVDIPIPQVIIDVQIIERSVEEGTDFSATFSYLGENDGMSYGGNYATPGAERFHSLKGNNLGGNYYHLGQNFFDRFQFQVNSEIQEGRARLMSSTRILCKNRETAQFNTGEKIPYYQHSEYTRGDNDWRYDNSESEETKSRNDDPLIYPSETERQRDVKYQQKEIDRNRKWQLQFIETGVNLWIKPYIRNSEWVELELKPSYSEITSMRSFNMPVLANRSLDTTVTVKNGDTFLLAGLLYEKEFRAIKGVPLLMDIPVLNFLFSSEISQKKQTEIVFMLTVHIHYPE